MAVDCCCGLLTAAADRWLSTVDCRPAGGVDSRVMWIDSHAHLTMLDPDERAAALQRAAAAGVAGVLVPATKRDDLDLTLALAAEHRDRIVAAAGVHPHDASTLDDTLKRLLTRSLDREGVVAVGEIGLDYHYMSSPREDQMRALGWQLDMAAERGLPVVLHNRESWTDLEQCVGERVSCKPGLRGVCHSFTEGPKQARKVIDWGLWIGISGMVTFKAADNIREMARSVPADRLLVETDSPFLAPVPHRGKRNEPAYVVEVGTRLAEVAGVAAADLAETSTNGFRELFGISDTWPGSANP